MRSHKRYICSTKQGIQKGEEYCFVCQVCSPTLVDHFTNVLDEWQAKHFDEMMDGWRLDLCNLKVFCFNLCNG